MRQIQLRLWLHGVAERSFRAERIKLSLGFHPLSSGSLRLGPELPPLMAAGDLDDSARDEFATHDASGIVDKQKPCHRLSEPLRYGGKCLVETRMTMDRVMSVARYHVYKTFGEQSVSRGIGALAESTQNGQGRYLNQASLSDPFLKLAYILLKNGIPFGMRDNRGQLLTPEAVKNVIEGPGDMEVRIFDQQVTVTVN